MTPHWQPDNKAESVARAALMEVGRLDLAMYIFGSCELVHFDDNAHDYHFHLKGMGPLPVPSLDDLALIERSMALGFHAADRTYACVTCERAFQRHGIVHMSDVSVAA